MQEKMTKSVGALTLFAWLTFFAAGFVACTSTNKNHQHAEAPLLVSDVKSEKPFLLEFKSPVHQTSTVDYYSASVIETYEGSQLIRHQDEGVDFQVKTLFKGEKEGVLDFITETVSKDGNMSLHDLAFPELNEKIEMQMKKDGTVQYVSHFDPSSIFYVPPLPFPTHEVQVGDTWSYRHSWVSMNNHLPMEVNLVIIFASLHSCGGGQCAHLEVSGEVNLPDELSKKLVFSSEIKGHLLFSIDKGHVVASRISNNEMMKMSDSMIRVSSCMIDQLKDPVIPIPTVNLSEEVCNPEKFDPHFSPHLVPPK